MANPMNLPTVPMTSGVLAAFLQGYKAPLNKIAEMEKHGEIVRLKRGVYLSAEAKGEASLMMAANHIYGPSYVSREFALRHYGLIPEHVFSVTSATTNRKREFVNPLGRFCYDFLPLEYYRLGLDLRVEGGASYQIATPEKALADYIVLRSGLRLRYISETMEFLEQDLRIDMELFRTLRPELFEQFAEVCRKPQAMLNLAKILRKK